MKIALGIFLVVSFSTPVLSQGSSTNADSIHSKRFYNQFSRNLKKQVKNEFEKMNIGDSIWIPLGLYDAGRSYGVISNYSNYPELPTFNLADTSNHSADCMVFGIVEDKKKDNGLFSVQILVKDVCGLDSLGGEYSGLVKRDHIFEHHLFPFWFFVN